MYPIFNITKNINTIITKLNIHKLHKKILCCVLLSVWAISGCCLDSENWMLFLGINLVSIVFMYLIAKNSGFVYGSKEYISPENYYSEPLDEEYDDC